MIPRDIGRMTDGPLETQSRSTFTQNNLQTLNYMDRTIDSNKDFVHFSEFNVFTLP